MAKPPERAKVEFEKVKVGEFINGVIENIEYEKDHVFKSKEGTKTAPAVRFVFKLDGYQYPHRSRWMTFSYAEKSNLYKNYLSKLILGAMPDMDMDLDVLKGVKVKTIWNEQNEFQFPENIFPVGDKYKLADLAKEDVQHEEVREEQEPF
jgi:hypothetical protein